MSDDKKVIFSMSGVSKTFPGANTPVIKNMYLSVSMVLKLVS